MANPRIPSDYWDDSEQEELHYPNATRRRVALAHALGILGVLGTLALAGVAFAPRMPFIASRVHSLFSKDEPALRPAQPVTQLPVTSPPAPTVTVPPPAPVPPAPDLNVTEPPTAAAAPAAPEPSVAAAAEPPVATVPAPTAAVPEPVAVPSAPASNVTSDEASQPTPQSAKPASRTLASSKVQRAPRSEPPLTMREIERRKERYEAWLKQEGLEPVR